MGDEPYDFRNASVERSRVERVVRRPHEVRVYLRSELERSVWLHFWPAAQVECELFDPGGKATHLTVDEGEARSHVRLWSGEVPLFEARAPHWSWHPFDTDEDEFLWQLAEDEKEAVRTAVRAVVERDLDVMRHLAPAGADRDFVDDFWTWADDEETDEPVRLLMPPGPFEEWDGYVMRMPGSTEVGIEFLEADSPEHSTDLTLRMELVRDADGSVSVTVQDLHVL